jgi:hypothetical protein
MDVACFRWKTAPFSPIPCFAAIAKRRQHKLPDSFAWIEHDPKSGNRFFEKMMLKQGDGIMIRFNLIGS